MKSNREGDEDPLVRQNNRIRRAFSLVHNLIYSIRDGARKNELFFDISSAVSSRGGSRNLI
jgi:hypothetical protein